MHAALHDVDAAFIAGGAEGVVVVVPVIVLRADFVIDVLGQVELEGVVGALAWFGETEGGASVRDLVGV